MRARQRVARVHLQATLPWRSYMGQRVQLPPEAAGEGARNISDKLNDHKSE